MGVTVDGSRFNGEIAAHSWSGFLIVKFFAGDFCHFNLLL